MENEIIMNNVSEEVIDEVVVPAVETAEVCCSTKGRSKLMPVLGAALIGVIAAGAIICWRKHRKSMGSKSAAQDTNDSYGYDFDDYDAEDDDEDKDEKDEDTDNK